MNPRQDDIDALARSIDRLVFHEPATREDAVVPSSSLALVSYLNDSFPRIALTGGRRERVQRRLLRALHIPQDTPPSGWGRLEAEMNRRLARIDPRWTPVVGGAALVLLGVVGVAVWRRGAARPVTAVFR